MVCVLPGPLRCRLSIQFPRTPRKNSTATQQSDTAVKYGNQKTGMVAQIANLREQVAAFLALNTTQPLANGWNG